MPDHKCPPIQGIAKTVSFSEINPLDKNMHDSTPYSYTYSTSWASWGGARDPDFL